MNKDHHVLKRNGLLIAFILLMLVTMVGQFFTGWEENTQERIEKNLPPYSIDQYLTCGHFIQATFENWESEFLQMGLYVYLTVYLFQKGSAESKSLDKPEAVDREPKPHMHAPWPVKKGGIYLAVYRHSLGLAFLVLFAISFFMHAYGTMKDINEAGLEQLRYLQVFAEERFWFESFQNWQSEFLSVASIVFLSIFLRQKGSPESKPVDAPHFETPG